MEGKYNRKMLIAMSGGVDSSVAAYLAKEEGNSCIGVTMRLATNEEMGLPAGHPCCTLDDVEDARRVAIRLGMPFYVFNFTDTFRREVVEKFAQAYLRGETPNPCVECNRHVKFAGLLQKAKELGCDGMATGHYARVEEKNGEYFLKKAADPQKDQTYMLCMLSQEQLPYVFFPLGDYEKTEVRQIAEREGFVTAHKQDSQDLCFAPDGDYARVIEALTGQKSPKGNFIDREGRILGKHEGIIHYTIGQRKGLGLSMGQPVFVCGKNITENTVTVGPPEALYTDTLQTDQFHWISGEAPHKPIMAMACTRYHAKEAPAQVTPLPGGGVKLRFVQPQRAVTPGQTLVLYQGDYTLGGGKIISSC